MDTIARIRREFYVRGKSVREICRGLRVLRNTVRKLPRSGETPFEHEREVQPRPKLGSWTEGFDALLLRSSGKSVRERLTLISVLEETREPRAGTHKMVGFVGPV
ncbi:hypothetical protein F0357_22005 [Rhizobiales bacterium Sp-1]|uniref:IS21 family transposase n=1 Tax=Segnochrobactrum spirostomi TaxID=2608987 RepID=A0A6A7YC70_9HYPH|nr:hypothetical protein [Segnochrobactrum spirostomi]